MIINITKMILHVPSKVTYLNKQGTSISLDKARQIGTTSASPKSYKILLESK